MIPKLLVFDLDGTLLGPNHRVPETARSLLFALRETGIDTTLATGRPFAAVGPFIEALEIECPMILFNGAAVVEPSGRVRWLQSLPLDTALAALRLLEETSAGNHVYMKPGDTHLVADRLGPVTDRILEKDGMPTRRVDDLTAYLEDGGAAPIKLFSIGPREELEAVRDRFLAIAPDATCVFSEQDMLEFLAPGVTKGSALRSLCNEIGIDPEDVAAFGDNLNDLELLRAAGHGVAMAASPSELRDSADDVTDDLSTYLEMQYGHLAGKERVA